jgi:hypothetical protein
MLEEKFTPVDGTNLTWQKAAIWRIKKKEMQQNNFLILTNMRQCYNIELTQKIPNLDTIKNI